MSDLKERLREGAALHNDAAELIQQLEEELADAKEFAKRCADSPIGKVIEDNKMMEDLLKGIVPLIPWFSFGNEPNLPISSFDYLKTQDRWKKT